jgi:hypothetical protein
MRMYCVIALLFLSCQLSPQQGVVSTNSTTSACGGFTSLAKRAAMPYSQDSSNYCTAEKIIWTYSPGQKQLDILHVRIGANCASKLEMTVEENAGTYTILQKDNKDPRIMADCDCVFDTYCELQNVQNGPVVFVYQGQSYNVDLANLTGSIVIDTTHLYQCDMRFN